MKKSILLFLALLPALGALAQWWPEVRVTNDPNISNTSLRRCLAASGDTVHLAWSDDCMPFPTIHYTRSLDAGLNWDTEQMLTPGDSLAEEPCIVSAGNMVHIVWYTCENNTSLYNEIAYMRSTDGGVTWENKIQLTNYGGLKWYPSIAVSGNYVHIVWYDECNGDWEVYYIRSTDYGATWEEKVRLTNQYDISAYCSVAASGPLVHVVWHDWRDGNKEVYYKRSADNGITWGEDTRLTFADLDSRFAEIAASGQYVQIAWQDNRDGDYDLYTINSTDGGQSWGTEQRQTYESSSSEFVDLAVEGQNAYMVWQDNISGLYQIYCKTSQDYGTTWSVPERILNTVYDANYASVAFSGEWLHVIWTDQRDGNNEVYCKNKFIENPIGINDLAKNDGMMELSIYPNPASSQISVFSRRSAGGGQQFAYSMTISNFQGQSLKEFRNICSFPYLIDISDLEDGMYILQVRCEDGKSSSKKLLKTE